jgi:hypothetical protein
MALHNDYAVIVQTVIMLNVIMLDVVAPVKGTRQSKDRLLIFFQPPLYVLGKSTINLQIYS